jgi:hypothetical protein
LNSFLTFVVEAFQAAGIKFAIHWGKNAPWAFPDLINYMYEGAEEKWKSMRSTLLTEEMANTFSNDFLDTAKLSDYISNLPNNLIALRETIADNGIG